MNPEELQHRYQHLRRELDAAYSAARWDAQRIDRITEQMVPVERALSRRAPARCMDAPTKTTGIAQQHCGLSV